MEDAKAHLLEGRQNKKKDSETSTTFINMCELWAINDLITVYSMPPDGE